MYGPNLGMDYGREMQVTLKVGGGDAPRECRHPTSTHESRVDVSKVNTYIQRDVSRSQSKSQNVNMLSPCLRFTASVRLDLEMRDRAVGTLGTQRALPNMYRGVNKGLFVLLSRTQAGSGRTVKQEQEEISRNHVQTFICPSVCAVTEGRRRVSASLPGRHILTVKCQRMSPPKGTLLAGRVPSRKAHFYGRAP